MTTTGRPSASASAAASDDEPVVVGQEMVRQLDEEAAGGRPVAPPEQRRVALGDGPRPGPVARPQATGQLAVAAARQRDEALGVLGEERLAEPRDGLGAGHVGVRHEPAQAPPADLRRASRTRCGPRIALADPAQVLLDRRRDGRAAGHATGAGGRAGPRSRRAAGVAGRPGAGRRATTPHVGRSATAVRRGGTTIPSGSGDGRIEQLDLETDDRMEPDRLGRGDEADRAIQAVVVGDGQPGQAQLDGPLDQVVGRRRAIEEREVGVAVEFGVRGRCHGSLRSGSRLTGGSPV